MSIHLALAVRAGAAFWVAAGMSACAGRQPREMDWPADQPKPPIHRVDYRKGEQPTVSQPDPGTWASIHEGSEWSEALRLLGPPTLSLPAEDDATCSWYAFGQIKYNTKEMGTPSEFSLIVDAAGRVVGKSDPFDGDVSLDCRPHPPKLCVPADGQVITEYPGAIDFRWKPSPGMYPLFYDVQVQIGTPTLFLGKSEPTVVWCDEWDNFTVEEPYLPLSMPGANPFRWRVRARNDRGTSEWTSWRRFDFHH